MIDLFADANDLSDDLIDVLDDPESKEERIFALVADFHGNVLNGGFEQAFYNMRSQFPSVIKAYEAVGLGLLARLISRSRSAYTGFLSYFHSASSRLDLETTYMALTYNLAFAIENNEFADGMGADSDMPDWVHKFLLLYARQNRNAFEHFVDSAERS